jgi:predicted GNAT superfamily acetyltransferase
MNDKSIRQATECDLAAILALNDAEVQWTSPLNRQQLQQLDQQACYHRVVCAADEQVVGFLLVLPPGADYASENYRWFSQQLEQFWYIDRIVIDAGQAGHGLGTRLYQDLIRVAVSQGIKQIACEFNLAPKNVVSERFHRSMGFAEVSQQTHNGKRVSLQVLQL